MESSTVIAFRAMVMLACLIVVPLAAIFGSQFPDVVKTMLVDKIWPHGEKSTAGESLSHAAAPPFSASPAPAWHNDPPAGGNAPGLVPPGGRPMSGPPSAVEPTAAWGASDNAVRHAMHEVPGSPPRSDNFAPPGAMPAGTSASQTDRFTWMERRLREYGATYYLLETWAGGGERYRFFCQMALANNPSHTRNFEATDSDPLRAMGRVVEQVEAWRTGAAGAAQFGPR
jgi:hypothetical protein